MLIVKPVRGWVGGRDETPSWPDVPVLLAAVCPCCCRWLLHPDVADSIKMARGGFAAAAAAGAARVEVRQLHPACGPDSPLSLAATAVHATGRLVSVEAAQRVCESGGLCVVAHFSNRHTAVETLQPGLAAVVERLLCLPAE